jgi:holin-like protein
MVKGSFIILLFLVVGEGISMLIDGFVPGSVIGMILLFAALQRGVIKPRSIESVAVFLSKNMALFFVPASVGFMALLELLGQHWLSIILASVLSTALVLAVVALIQEKFGRNEHTDA